VSLIGRIRGTGQMEENSAGSIITARLLDLSGSRGRTEPCSPPPPIACEAAASEPRAGVQTAGLTEPLQAALHEVQPASQDWQDSQAPAGGEVCLGSLDPESTEPYPSPSDEGSEPPANSLQESHPPTQAAVVPSHEEQKGNSSEDAGTATDRVGSSEELLNVAAAQIEQAASELATRSGVFLRSHAEATVAQLNETLSARSATFVDESREQLQTAIRTMLESARVMALEESRKAITSWVDTQIERALRQIRDSVAAVAEQAVTRLEATAQGLVSQSEQKIREQSESARNLFEVQHQMAERQFSKEVERLADQSHASAEAACKTVTEQTIRAIGEAEGQAADRLRALHEEFEAELNRVVESYRGRLRDVNVEELASPDLRYKMLATLAQELEKTAHQITQQSSPANGSKTA
jgi:hypothetical protein